MRTPRAGGGVWWCEGQCAASPAHICEMSCKAALPSTATQPQRRAQTSQTQIPPTPAPAPAPTPAENKTIAPGAMAEQVQGIVDRLHAAITNTVRSAWGLLFSRGGLKKRACLACLWPARRHHQHGACGLKTASGMARSPAWFGARPTHQGTVRPAQPNTESSPPASAPATKRRTPAWPRCGPRSSGSASRWPASSCCTRDTAACCCGAASACPCSSRCEQRWGVSFLPSLRLYALLQAALARTARTPCRHSVLAGTACSPPPPTMTRPTPTRRPRRSGRAPSCGRPAPSCPSWRPRAPVSAECFLSWGSGWGGWPLARSGGRRFAQLCCTPGLA